MTPTHVASRMGNVLWGLLPSEHDPFVAKIRSGDVITVDALSHEGIMEDQGRDPRRWLESRGLDPSLVLPDAVEIAGEYPGRDPLADGPHVVTGPIGVEGAEPGDVLRVDYLELLPRTPFGVVSSRHGYGALPGEYPLESTVPLGDPEIEWPGLVSVLCSLEGDRGSERLLIKPRGALPAIELPFAPFLGLVGVVPAGTGRLNSIPPSDYGGNMDIRDLVTGTSLYLPVQIEGAGLYLGDPHYAQGHGEVALTAVEASLAATIRVSVLKGVAATSLVGALTTPFGESATHWFCVGMDRDLDEAMRRSVREALRFLRERFSIPTEEAYAYLSAAADFVVTQVVDGVKGVHCQLRKQDFRSYLV